MKKIFITLLTLPSFFALAQDNTIPLNSETGKAEYTEVITQNGIAASDLFERAKTWITGFYPNPNGTIKSEDLGAGEIKLKGRFRLLDKDKKGVESSAGFVSYNCDFSFKDGKYRYVISNIRWEQTSYFDVSKWEKKTDPMYQAEKFPLYVSQTDSYFTELLESLKKAMAQEAKKANDNW